MDIEKSLVKLPTRTQKEIIDELNVLTSSYSFRYILAKICVRDFCGYVGEASFKNVHEHLNHNEFFFLLGLWVKNVDVSKDDKVNLKRDLKQCYELMQELHDSFLAETPKPNVNNPDTFRDTLVSSATFKESFFYSGTGAYDFQFSKWLIEKYKHDQTWLMKNASLQLSAMQGFFLMVKNKLHERLNKQLKKFVITDEEILDIFCYEKGELCAINGNFGNIVEAFAVKVGERINESFNAVGDYNALSEKPIIQLANGKLFLPQPHALAEAMFEAPFYWMNSDKAYKDTALKNRGNAAEDITYKIVRGVYGAKQTLKDVKLIEFKGKVITDIDVLAIFANTAIIFQVKSKKLTALSKQGNVDAVKSDFRKAVSDALNQGLKARGHLLNNANVKIINADGRQILQTKIITNCEVVAITLDTYPAIAHLSRMLLIESTMEQFPVAMTVFDLEVIARYIKTPQAFFEYFFRRRTLSNYFITENELGYLGYHLRYGLKKVKDVDWFQLDATWTQYIDNIYYPEIMQISKQKTKEPGRNDPCPCGSGKKYKKCHGIT
jgi:hypothetical protein